MLVLFETPAGYALFKVLKEGKLDKVDDIFKEFTSAEKAHEAVKLEAFAKFRDTTEALSAATATVETSLDKQLKKFLKKNVVSKELQDKMAVADPKLAGLIKKKLSINCVSDNVAMELMRGIRSQVSSLVTGMDDKQIHAMYLGLAHSLGRYKLKFSPDKVDTMIVQAIGLLDELDKEINTYSMRVKEWYGWHFPEMAKVVNDNQLYAKLVLKMGPRNNCVHMDLSDILEDETMEEELKSTSIVSMGTDVSDQDMANIKSLCEQVIDMTLYRAQLFEYLKARMMAIAPNLTVMVGELVGARLISHAGSLLNLAKHPASTVQILGAEKALFRALKTRSQTPKYGLIYHASLIGQASPKHKGKISRVLAAKTALAIRVDALGEGSEVTIGHEAREKVEARLRQLETGGKYQLAGKAQGRSKTEAHNGAARAADAPLQQATSAGAFNADGDAAGIAADSSSDDDAAAKKAKKAEKKAKKRARASEADEEAAEDAPKKKKKDKKEKKAKKDKKRKSGVDGTA